jgi:DNA polymerase kappa
MLAKVASDMNKPDGQFAVDASERGMLAFLHGLPVRKVPGVGKATEKLLKEVLDVHTVGELWERRDRLALAFTQIQSTWLLRVYMCDTESAGATPRGFGSGVGVSSLQDHGAERQSFSIERTFRDEARPAELETRLRELCRDLAAECVEKGAAGRCVTLKLKGANDFQVHSKQISFATAVPRHGAEGADLHEVALPLLKPLLGQMQPPTVRLMGVRVTHLDAKPSASSSSAKTPGPLDKLFARQVAQLSEQERRRLEHEHEPEGQEGNGPHEPPSQLVVDICAEDEHEGGSGCAGDPQASLCPVCSHALPDDNAAINEHLDSCLRIPTASSGEPSKRARTIDYFFRRQAP